MGKPVPADDIPTGLSYSAVVPDWDLPDGQGTSAASTGPTKIGRDAYADTLRQTVREAPWWARNLAGAGSAMENIILGAKQFFGDNNQRAMEEQRILAEEAPVGAIAGNVALVAPTVAIPGANTLTGSALIGAGVGALQPAQGTTAAEIARNKARNATFGAGAGLVGQAGGTMLANRLASAKAAKVAEQARNAQRDAALAESQAAGYVVPPSVAGAGPGSRTMESLSGKYKTNQLMGIRNEQTTNALARRAVGLKEADELTPDTLRAIRSEAYTAGYEPVAGFGRVATDDTYRKAMEGIVQEYRGAARSFPGAVPDDVVNLIEGRTTQAGTPDKSVWVNSFGDVLEGFKPPQAPPMRSLIDDIRKAGGISMSEADELGMSAKEAAKAFPGLFRKQGGMTADDLVEWMGQHEWVHPGSIADADAFKAGGSHDLARDYVRSALNKETVVHPRDADAWFEFNDAMNKLQNEGVKKITVPGKEESRGGGLLVGEFDTGDAIQMIQVLRNGASESFAKGATGLGKAQRKAAVAMEDQIERALMQAGKPAQDMLKGFRESRKLMAKTHSLERALQGSQVDARALGRQLKAGKPLSGDLKTIGQFGLEFGDVAGVPKTGHANPFTVVDFGLTGSTGLLAGAASGNPLASLVALGMPAARVASRYAIASPAYQGSFVHPSYGVPITTNALGRLGEAGLIPGLATGATVPAFAQ